MASPWYFDELLTGSLTGSLLYLLLQGLGDGGKGSGKGGGDSISTQNLPQSQAGDLQESQAAKVIEKTNQAIKQKEWVNPFVTPPRPELRAELSEPSTPRQDIRLPENIVSMKLKALPKQAPDLQESQAIEAIEKTNQAIKQKEWVNPFVTLPRPDMRTELPEPLAPSRDIRLPENVISQKLKSPPENYLVGVFITQPEPYSNYVTPGKIDLFTTSVHKKIVIDDAQWRDLYEKKIFDQKIAEEIANFAKEQYPLKSSFLQTDVLLSQNLSFSFREKLGALLRSANIGKLQFLTDEEILTRFLPYLSLSGDVLVVDPFTPVLWGAGKENTTQYFPLHVTPFSGSDPKLTLQRRIAVIENLNRELGAQNLEQMEPKTLWVSGSKKILATERGSGTIETALEIGKWKPGKIVWNLSPGSKKLISSEDFKPYQVVVWEKYSLKAGDEFGGYRLSFPDGSEESFKQIQSDPRQTLEVYEKMLKRIPEVAENYPNAYFFGEEANIGEYVWSLIADRNGSNLYRYIKTLPQYQQHPNKVILTEALQILNLLIKE